MANPTTNYGFVLPTPTDLVTDLPADFDVALQGVDTRLKALNPSTTLGDIEYRSSTANTNVRLPIGTTSQVLSVVGGVPAWTSPASNLESYNLINTGGTALTGASTITITGISNKNSLLIVVDAASANQPVGNFSVRFNSDSGSNYYWSGPYQNDANNLEWNFQPTATSHNFGSHFTTATNSVNAIIKVDGAAGIGYKFVDANGYFNGASGANVRYTGYYKGTSAISSVSIVQTSGAGQFDAGTVFVYGA